MSPYIPVILGALAQLRIPTISLIVSARPHETIRLPLEGFSFNLKFEFFSKTYREKFKFNSNLTRIEGALHEH